MNILMTICGRAGSKGIPEKNIRDFLGYPLPYYTFSAIELYKKSNKEDRIDVAVNTDSEKLIEIAKNNPFVDVEIIVREEELGGDRVPKPAVICSTLVKMEDRFQTHYDMVVDLDLTSPLRKVEDIVHLIEKQKACHADVTFSVTDSRRNPYFNITHLTESYGLTIREIDDRIDYKIPISVKSDTEKDISANQADALVKFTDLFVAERFDAVILLGDRYETLAIAAAAGNTRTPVFHLCGGDTTEGALDEWIRHSITKISYLHFVTNIDSQKRVIQLGECPDRVLTHYERISELQL